PASTLRLTLARPAFHRAVTVAATCDRPCSLVATGSVMMSRRAFRLVRTSATLDAAGSRTLTLRVPSGLARLLKAGRRAEARITVRATSAGGASVAATRVVVVRR